MLELDLSLVYKRDNVPVLLSPIVFMLLQWIPKEQLVNRNMNSTHTNRFVLALNLVVPRSMDSGSDLFKFKEFQTLGSCQTVGMPFVK